MTRTDPFNCRDTIQTPLGDRMICRLDAVSRHRDVAALPYCIKVLLEATLRRFDGLIVTEEHIKALAGYDAKNTGNQEIPFMPGRVVMQDFTGVPSIVDLAAMRDAVVELTGDEASANQINPRVPCDLVIDHSVQVDAFASGMALTINSQKEFERNKERYQFLKWGQQAFTNFRVVPPATGIIHQVNLEYLAKVVWAESDEGKGTSGGHAPYLYPDSLVGTDSHTTMINGLGVVGWGVGGIEAEAVMLGQPIYMLIPEVVGFRLTGKLPEGATATDLVLRVTEMLRARGVVGKFVEFFGPGLAEMPLANRATIANMAPEYGATMGFFPVDEQTTRYLRLTGRSDAHVRTVEQYCQEQGLWRDESRAVRYTDELELDMSQVVPSLAGPKRPQDRIALSDMATQWRSDLVSTFGKTVASGGAAEATATPADEPRTATAVAELPDPDLEGVAVENDGETFTLGHGAVVIAAITSCTNTSNPEVMIGAGLLARNARACGLSRKPWVKTSLAPGSKVVTDYYGKAGLMPDLEALGFNLVGYGCTTCIGNSGPLPEPISAAIREHDLVACSVLSGNRNFEGRINPDVKANYLTSPPLVVAYAITGTVNIDLTTEPLGQDGSGRNVFLRDIWPSQQEILDVIGGAISRDQFTEQYASAFEGSEEWRAISTTGGKRYDWHEASTYIRHAPFFVGLTPKAKAIEGIRGARALCVFGDSVTTDHISPAGAIPKDSPAGRYLVDQGVPVSMFNSFGSRRGNHEVMIRGTFGNIRVRNLLVPGTEGGYTVELGKGTKGGEPGGHDVIPIYDAAMKYKEVGIPLVVLAGKDYGMGSSRDWAAKGTILLGVKAVLAESFERIHRSNLVGMGVLPLQFEDGQTRETLGLTGHETFDIEIDDGLQPMQDITVTATDAVTGNATTFTAICRIDTPVEVEYYRNGGILHTVLRQMAR